MEVKNIRFFAPSVMERATKLVICLVIFLLLNCGNVFAITEEQIEGVIEQTGFSNIKSQSRYNALKEKLLTINADNLIIGATAERLIFYETTETPRKKYSYSDTYYVKGVTWYSIYYESGSTKQLNNYQNDPESDMNFMYSPYNKMWLPKGVLNYAQDGYIYEPGYDSFKLFKGPKTPYFEFSANKVGTATFEDEDGNVNTYYRNSFPIWTNSYGTFREIGNLYIDKDYIFEDIFSPTLNITKSNFNMTNSWEYKEYSFFKHEEINGYIRYSINIRNELLTSPYFYNIEIATVNSEISDDINIKFVILNNPTTGGIIIENNSGDIISGDEIKDETTLGDINNTVGSINDSINESYDKDESKLNNLTSGDVLENLGYEITEDPNADLWDTIINGLKEVLTGNGNIVFEFELRKTKHTINSNQIRMPDNELKTFIGLAINFYFLIQMFQFIKRTIDQINEGNLKVMHDVDADCYFF